MSSQIPKRPLQEKTYTHRAEIQMRFNDIDIYGHANNAIYLQYFDIGKLRYLEAAIGSDFIQKGFTAVIVHIECDFFSPTTLEENIVVDTSVVRMGDKSITFEQRIINPTTDDLKCSCRTVMAVFNPFTLKSAPIPEELRKEFEKFEGKNLSAAL